MKLANRNMVKNTAGFTLVELMVVVAIIGILAAVAIPNFQKYQAKSKASEAKIALSSWFTAEESFYAEYGAYSACGPYLGIQTGATADTNAYYTVGFGAASVPTIDDPSHNQATIGSAYQCQGTDMVKLGGKTAASPSVLTKTGIVAISASPVAAGTYTVAAAGIIEKSHKDNCATSVTATMADCWTIDQTKKLKNHNVGY